jgi:hypothetical protein
MVDASDLLGAFEILLTDKRALLRYQKSAHSFPTKHHDIFANSLSSVFTTQVSHVARTLIKSKPESSRPNLITELLIAFCSIVGFAQQLAVVWAR